MTPVFRSVGRGPGGRRYLSSERELRLGVYFWFRLFNVVPETTARFSYLDDRSRDQITPMSGLPTDLIGPTSLRPVPAAHFLGGPGGLPLGVAGHDHVALVVELAPLGQGQLDLGLAILEVQRDRDDG